MNHDEDLIGRLERLRTYDEPPMASSIDDDVARGRRALRKRFAAWGAGSVAAVSVAALATAVAVANPFGTEAGTNLRVAGPASGGENGTVGVPPEQPPAKSKASEGSGKAKEGSGAEKNTRERLFGKALEHFDKGEEHLTDESKSWNGGGLGDHWKTGTKLDWHNEGEDGLGYLHVFVTTPGYVDAEEYALEGLLATIGCSADLSNCAEQKIPGTDTVVWTAEPGGEAQDLELGVLYERPDGSVVGVGAYTLFGNNSETPVSEVGITPEQAFAFVTDPELDLDPDVAEREWKDDERGAFPREVPEG